MQQNKLLVSLAAICILAWIVAAIQPFDRLGWILENILLVLFIAVLFLTHRVLRLSNTSYLLLTAFVLLHIAAAHYTYARMPLGYWVNAFTGFTRNNSDRIIHFGFGALLFFPVRELLLRFTGIRVGWSYWLAASAILAASGLFEILESIVAEIIAPGKGVDWLGGQGDEWDAQNDMLSALLGALFTMAIVALLPRRNIAR